MEPFVAKLIYLLGVWIANFAIRIPHIRVRQRQKLREDHKTRTDTALFLAASVGGFVLPLLYVFTPWLAFADYPLALPIGIIGSMLLVPANWLFWRAHRDLAENWSPVLELHEGHQLVTRGIYSRVRHPMYAALWLLLIAQAMILPNWIAGCGGLVPFAALYFQRVQREEAMMRRTFGAAYDEHVRRTGRLFPKLSKA